jgi:hypothetical protein
MKKILILGLVLALALVIAVPTAAMAAPPSSLSSPDYAFAPAKSAAFQANATLTSIDEGKVKELGNSGKWLVKDRHLQGSFDPDADIKGDFTLTYGGVFNIADQSGNLIGTLKAGKVTCAVVGETQPMVPDFTGITMIPDPTSATGELVYVLPCAIQVTGHWTGVKNLKANGNFDASLVLYVQLFMVDPADSSTWITGHVLGVDDVNSYFNMTGKYYGKR